MRIKTFVATYLLFLTVLFSSVGIVSFYLNNSQINMLRDTSAGHFQTIVTSLDRDVAVLWGRTGQGGPGAGTASDFYEAAQSLVRGYARYYSRHNINITLTNLRLSGSEPPPSELVFDNNDEGYFIFITGMLSAPFDFFLVDYSLDITESIMETRNIQRTLMVSVVAFSVIAAVGLYLILSSIFKPLSVVANASKEIANGRFSERIPVKAKNELAQVAIDFNKMAERMERQIIMLEEESENKQQFVDNFAHEMRTPLTSIYGYAEYLQKAVLEDGEIVELSGRIMNRAGYLQEIANSLLQLAMLRNYTPEKKEIQVQHLFDDISHTVMASMDEGKVNFNCKTDVDVLYGQEDLIKSLMLNLCLNALKACSPNNGAVCMSAKYEGVGVTLSVTDNGCGIPADSLAKVTEPFYRIDKSRNRKAGGAGIGLALCKKIADAHGAEMTIESTIGVGTTVRIFFTTP